MAETGVVIPPIDVSTPGSSAPAEVPTPGRGSNLESAFSGLDKYAREPSAKQDRIPPHPAEPKRKEEAQKPAEAAKPVEDKTPVIDDPADPTAKPAEAAKPGEVPAKPKKPSDFMREEIAKLKAERDSFRTELDKLKAPKEDPEKVELKTKWEGADKRLKEVENELRFANYERSSDYQDKYLKPFQAAVQAGRSKVKSLDVVQRTATDDGGTEKITQQSRPATEEDFDQIMYLPSDRDARQLAKQLFGEDAPIALQHREKVLELNQVRAEALESYKKNGAEREKELLTQRDKQAGEMKKFQAELRKSNEAAFLERHPELAKLAEDDKDAATILEKDLRVTDRLFGENNYTPDELVSRHAEMRNRAARFGLLLHLFRAQAKKLAEATESLQAFEGSEPAGGTGVKAKEDASSDTMAGVLAGFDKIAKPGGL